MDKDQLILVNYETLFYETEQADDFFKGIGLEMNDGARARFKGLKQDGLNKDNGRESILTSYDKKRILKNARFDLYSDLANSSKNILPELNPPLVDSVQEMLDKKKANNS